MAFPTPGRAVDFGIDTVYHRNDGSILVQQRTAATIQTDWTSSRHTVGSGWSDPGEWAAGRYSAELSIDGELVATTWFEITEDPQLILDQGSPLTLPSQLQQLAERLPWTQDGLSYVEQRALGALWHMQREDRELACYVASLPWTLDSITSDERGALEHLALLAKQATVLASGLARVPWLANHVSSAEWDVLRTITLIGDRDPKLAQQLASLPWSTDDITESESEALEHFQVLTEGDAAMAARVAAFSWVADAFTEDERWTLRHLSDLTLQSPMLGTTVAGFSWMADSITADQRWALRYLLDLAELDPVLAEQLAAGQFLSGSFEDRDQYALYSVLQLADSPEDLDQLTATTWFQDGVDHQEAALITVLPRQSRVAPEEFQSLVSGYDYQSSSVTLPLAGEVQLTILRLAPEEPLRADGQMDRLEAAVQQIEAFMGLPFPQKDVILLYAETGTQTTGVYVGTHMVVDRPLVIQGDLRRVEAHEVSHYYWHRGVPIWFQEGAAEFLTTLVVSQVYGDSFQSRVTEVGGSDARRCQSLGMGTLRQLVENLAIVGYEEQSLSQVIVADKIGALALFLDLYQAMGADSLQSAWRRIYQAADMGHDHTEAEIYQVFSEEGLGDTSGDFRRIYSLWHGGDF